MFFIDDQQVVRPDETGSITYISEHAKRLGCEINQFELEVQFRCGGSDGFVNWIDNTLAIRRTPNVLWTGDEHFDFQIVNSVEALDNAIRDKTSKGVSARLVAGYCWPWSDPTSTGKLADDVVIGDWKRPWNARPDAGRLANGIPPAPLWAYDKGGVDQVGCVYTAQGFEFDYVGVIWGTDLVYRFDKEDWVADKQASKDSTVKRSGDRFRDLVKNTYRVLLSRGMKGCYVYFVDKETEKFVRSRTEGLGTRVSAEQIQLPDEQVRVTPSQPPQTEEVLPFRKLSTTEAKPYVNCVPLIDLKFAAGAFSDTQTIDESEVEWVELPEGFRAQPGLFVAQVIGESMNRRIPSGSWCLFKTNPVGTRQGKVVVAQHQSIHDPDCAAGFTVKVYESEKNQVGDSWMHSAIRLRPDSTDTRFKSVVIDMSKADGLRIVAELVAVFS